VIAGRRGFSWIARAGPVSRRLPAGRAAYAAAVAQQSSDQFRPRVRPSEPERWLGRHRRINRWSVTGVIGLVVALGVALRLLFSPTQVLTPAGQQGIVGSPPPAWAGRAPVRQPAKLTDGTRYTPLLYLDANTSVGTAPTGAGEQIRVLLRTATSVRELHRVAATGYPQFDGFTTDGDTLVWAESLTSPHSPVRTSIWWVNWRRPGPARLVTSDTGDAVFFQSQYDLVLNRGRVWWVAVQAGRTAMTQVRSVPVTGGRVSMTRQAGSFALTAYPWLVTVSTSQSTPIELVNLATRHRIRVATGPTESARCSPTWCRVVVLGAGGPQHIDIERPDGTQRRRIAGGNASAVVSDVALLDRYEVITIDGPTPSAVGAPSGGQLLTVYDLSTGRSTLVAAGVAQVGAHGAMLWWSTGSATAPTWSAIDLG
jgi:hypothetical protein